MVKTKRKAVKMLKNLFMRVLLKVKHYGVKIPAKTNP